MPATPNYETIQSAFNGVVLSRAETDPMGRVRAEGRLFDVCLDNGMDFDEPNHIEWAAVQLGDWLSTGDR